MNTINLRTAQLSLEDRKEEIIRSREPLHAERERFIEHFTLAHIRQMKVEAYAIGYPRTAADYNFCYGIDRKLDGLGKILGANATKFGIYYSTVDLEKQRLLQAGKARLAAQVKKVELDAEGFDISSFEQDGTTRRIEVKTTLARIGQVNFFLTANEQEKSGTLDCVSINASQGR